MLLTLDARTLSAASFEVERAAVSAILISHCDRYVWPAIFARLSDVISPQASVSTFSSDTDAIALPLADLSGWWGDRGDPVDGWNCYIPPQPEAALDASLSALAQLMGIVAQLRSPEGGCPWDRAQTPVSLTPYVLEEAYEAVAAIRSGDRDDIVQELGDYLFQVVLQAQIFSESGAFSLADVAHSISDKLVRRHPHVFGPDAGEISVSEIKQNWEAIKSAERGEESLADTLHHYATTLPPLVAATKMAKTLVRQHLIESDRAIALQQLRAALERLETVCDYSEADAARSGLGELLQASVLLACHLSLDPSVALQAANEIWVRDRR
ncbi:MAG: MazG family protein [Cyanobacteria bacterium J06648_11]